MEKDRHLFRFNDLNAGWQDLIEPPHDFRRSHVSLTLHINEFGQTLHSNWKGCSENNPGHRVKPFRVGEGKFSPQGSTIE